jgi:hypothetical protein
MNDHEIELFYNNDLLMMLRVIVLYYLVEVDLLEEMVVMVVVWIQQSRIKQSNIGSYFSKKF